MRYVLARLDEYYAVRAYRIYVTDGMRILCGGGERYADLLKPPENRSADDIIGNIREKLGG